MKPSVNFAAWYIAGLIMVVSAQASAAIVEGRTPSGVAYTSGGVSTEELDTLRQRLGGYTLHLTTAAKSGAHLASVVARIKDSAGSIVLEHTMEGPWLLAKLPAGRYAVELRYPAQGAARELLERRDITVGSGGLTETTVHFPTGD